MKRLHALLVLPLLTAVSAHAGVIDLGSMIGGANIFTLGDFSAPSSDVEGALISGGNVTLARYSVNELNKDAYGENGYALVARNNLTLTGGSITHGLAYVGGTSALSFTTAPPMAASSPIDFDAAAAYYRNLSSSLATVNGTGTVSKLWSGVIVTGNGNGKADVFNVSADMFRTSNNWTVENLTEGQTLIFNVSGTNVTFNDGGIGFAPLAGYNVLFNLYEATQVNVKGIIGSVLAPDAAVTANWGVINGQVVVGSWNSTIQVNANHYFQTIDLPGYTPARSADVPEPGSLPLMLFGAGALALIARRRKGAQAA